MPVLCQESNMFPAGRHPSPVPNYTYGHFHGYQGTQYTSQTQDFSQYVDPNAAFQQQYYGSGTSMARPQGMDDWMNYSAMPTTTSASLSPQSMHYSYRPGGMEYSQHSAAPLPQGNQSLTILGSPPQSEGSPTSTTSSGSSGSPSNKQLRPPFDWMKKASYTTSTPSAGKTRTKDKYRVVYSDHQRLELEKEFHYSRYITIRRKSELAQTLALSERQVKIWFQNRRAKERKQNKKREDGGKPSTEVGLHNEGMGDVPGMSLPLNNIHIKSDPSEDYCQSTTHMQDQGQGHMIHPTSPLHVNTTRDTSPLHVPTIKMDPSELVTQHA
ncbi:homeobox protein CDX-1-like [Argopecten irradians]|uniref:homeobox protein CDX-1-like n=1 Tax=Argopecten irradians TaxID=31199 RepID=UPI003717D871